MNINDIDSALDEMMSISGALAAAVIDWESGMSLGMRSNGHFDIELAAAGNSEVIKAKVATINSIGLNGLIKDLLITLTDQIHIITMIEDQPELCLYVAMDSAKANLALARHKMQKVAQS